jgi:hypothetical protein
LRMTRRPTVRQQVEQVGRVEGEVRGMVLLRVGRKRPI